MPDDIDAFIEHWSRAAASERANAQQFLIELADLLGVPRPINDHHEGYSFEFPLKIPRTDGTFTQGFIDLYRRSSFVLEAKQFLSPSEAPSPLLVVAEEAGLYTAKKKSGPVRGSEAWDDAMIKARGQAERYARSLPANEPSPPFLLIVDVGHSIAVLANFTQAGKAYLPFPDPRRFRIRLTELREEHVRDLPPAAPATSSTSPSNTTSAQPTLALPKDAKPKPKTSKAKTPWPKSLAERVRLVDETLRQSVAPLTAEALAKHLTRAKADDITEILETLTTLGRAHRDGDKFTG